MLRLKQYLTRRLTVVETAVAIVIVAALAALGYGLYDVVAEKVLELRVNAAIPTVRAGLREQRQKVVDAIEAYKAHFGFYPPEHLLQSQPRVADPVTNTLLYELGGVIYEPAHNLFQVGGLEAADAKYVKAYLQCDGFTNCSEQASQVKRFLDMKPLPALQLHDDPDVFALGCVVPYEGLEQEVAWEFHASSWRYVSSSATNNPGRFDLWMELRTKKRELVIGNWKAAD